jgi:RimJ/RimL family protein N-acetyltransferase
VTGSAGPGFAVRGLTADDLADIATWAYDGPWSVYDSDGPLDPSTGYWAVVRDDGRLAGFVCVGQEARVPGLPVAADVLDVGVGMRPELVGRGSGAAFAAAALVFAASRAAAERFRVVVQDWNQRSLRLVARLGFRRTGSHPVGDVTFVVLERPVRPG